MHRYSVGVMMFKCVKRLMNDNFFSSSKINVIVFITVKSIQNDCTRIEILENHTYLSTAVGLGRDRYQIFLEFPKDQNQ